MNAYQTQVKLAKLPQGYWFLLSGIVFLTHYNPSGRQNHERVLVRQRLLSQD